MKKLTTTLVVILLAAVMLTFTACNISVSTPYTMEGLSFTDATFAYDGQPHTITVSGLPTGASVTYSPSNTQTEPGTYTIVAVASANGYVPAVLTATLTITAEDTEDVPPADISGLIERLDAAIAEANATTDEKLSALRAEYDAVVAELNAAAASAEAELTALTEAYNAKAAELTAASEKNAADLKALTDKYAADLAVLESADAANAEAIAALEANYAAAVAALNAASEKNAADLKPIDLPIGNYQIQHQSTK